MTEQIDRWEESGWRRQAGPPVPKRQALLTLFFPLAFLFLTGMALQLGLLQGPVEFLRPLLFLEANLLFSSLPLLFLFPLRYHGDRMTLGEGNRARAGKGWAVTGRGGPGCPSRLCLYPHEMVILTPNQAMVRIKWPEICERFVDSKAFCNSKRTLGHPWSHFHSRGRGEGRHGEGPLVFLEAS